MIGFLLDDSKRLLPQYARLVVPQLSSELDSRGFGNNSHAKFAKSQKNVNRHISILSTFMNLFMPLDDGAPFMGTSPILHKLLVAILLCLSQQAKSATEGGVQPV